METVNQRLPAGADLATYQSKGSLQALHTARCGFPAFEWDNLRKELGSIHLVECVLWANRYHLHQVCCTCLQVAIMTDHRLGLWTAGHSLTEGGREEGRWSPT